MQISRGTAESSGAARQTEIEVHLEDVGPQQGMSERVQARSGTTTVAGGLKLYCSGDGRNVAAQLRIRLQLLLRQRAYLVLRESRNAIWGRIDAGKCFDKDGCKRVEVVDGSLLVEPDYAVLKRDE